MTPVSKQRSIHALPASGALAFEQGRQNTERHPGSSAHIDDRDAGANGRMLAGAGDAHDAGSALDQSVVAGLGVIRPARAISGQRRINDVGFAGANGRLVQAESSRFAAAEILHEDIAAGSQPEHDLAPRGFGDVDRDGALAAIERNEKRAPGAAMGTHAAGVVAAVDPFDLDNVGAQIGQDHGGGWAGHDVAEVQHANAC